LREGHAALAVASGSAAITYAVQNIALAGPYSFRNQFIRGYNKPFIHTLREQGIETSFVDQANPINFEAAIRPNTKLLYAETLGNPTVTLLI
jgi:O-acetylhomoserine (thiol)-lyase